MKLEKPLYGSCDAGFYGKVAIQEHATNDLDITSISEDIFQYTERFIRSLVGIRSTYEEESLNLEQKVVENQTEQTLVKYDSRLRVYDHLFFSWRPNEETETINCFDWWEVLRNYQDSS